MDHRNRAHPSGHHHHDPLASLAKGFMAALDEVAAGKDKDEDEDDDDYHTPRGNWLYHYTSIEFKNKIIKSGTLSMTTLDKNPEYGAGVYLTDLPPQCSDETLEEFLRQHPMREEGTTLRKTRKHAYLAFHVDALKRYGYEAIRCKVKGGRQFVIRKSINFDPWKDNGKEWRSGERM